MTPQRYWGSLFKYNFGRIFRMRKTTRKWLQSMQKRKTKPKYFFFRGAVRNQMTTVRTLSYLLAYTSRCWERKHPPIGETKYTTNTLQHKNSPYCKHSTLSELGAGVCYVTNGIELSLGFSIEQEKVRVPPKVRRLRAKHNFSWNYPSSFQKRKPALFVVTSFLGIWYKR